MSRLVSRRGVLGAGLALGALVACRRPGHAMPVAGASALDAALGDEDRLIAAYAAALGAPSARAATLRRVRADHLAHRAALIAAGATPSPAPTQPPVAGPALTVAGLVAAETAAAGARTAACLATSPELAPLFGSLAASEAAHAVAMRDAGSR